jgi:hypothetical protein
VVPSFRRAESTLNLVWTEPPAGKASGAESFRDAATLNRFALAHEHGKTGLGSFDLADWSRETFWVILLNGVFVNLQNFGIGQNYIQRYITARSDREARRAVWFGGLLYVPVSLVFFFIGAGLFAYYAAQPDLLPAAYREPGMGDRVLPFFIVSELPVGIRGLLISAIFASAMSTVSTSLNSSATIIYTDYYKRYFRRTAGEKESMRFPYAVSLLWGLILHTVEGWETAVSQTAVSAAQERSLRGRDHGRGVGAGPNSGFSDLCEAHVPRLWLSAFPSLRARAVVLHVSRVRVFPWITLRSCISSLLL